MECWIEESSIKRELRISSTECVGIVYFLLMDVVIGQHRLALMEVISQSSYITYYHVLREWPGKLSPTQFKI